MAHQPQKDFGDYVGKLINYQPGILSKFVYV